MMKVPGMRVTAAFVLSALLVAVAPAARAADALTPKQTQAINQLIHDYLMKNPRILAEALQNAEEAAKAEETANKEKLQISHRDELEHDPETPVLGNPDGEITLVEFFDYRCPYCKASATVVEKLIEQDKKVRVVVKDFPVLGKESVYASRVALVAQKHGKYAEFYKAMFNLPDKVTPDSTMEVAKSVGLDLDQVRVEMQSPEVDAILKRNYELGQALGVDGTPAFMIGALNAPGAMTLEDLQHLIAEGRAATKS